MTVLLGALIFIAAPEHPPLWMHPGGDFNAEIANRYHYADAGGDGKVIFYNDGRGGRDDLVVISARVDGYIVKSGTILVARRPLELFKTADGVTDSRLLDRCEFWMIDTRTHEVRQTSPIEGLSCKGLEHDLPKVID